MADAQQMLDAISNAVYEGLAAGESRIHVTLAREITLDSGLVQTEFVVVEGFQCAEPDCPVASHVRVYSAAPQYEYPQHLAHPPKEIR